MIQVAGQYSVYFALDDGSGDSEISEGEFSEFKAISSASALLPRFSLCFRTQDDSFVAALEKGSVLRTGVGLDPENLISNEWKPLKFRSTRIAGGDLGIEVSGLLNSVDFLRSRGNYVTDGPKSGLEAIVEAMGSRVRVDADPEKSEDSQLWFQGGKTLKRFVLNTWLHSKLTDGVPLIGFNSRGDFIIRALREDTLTGGSTMGPYSGEIPVDGGYIIDDSGGFHAAWAGNNQGFYQLDQQTEVDRWLMEIEREGGPLDVFSDIGREEAFMGVGRLSHNMHADYWTSYVKNLSTLAHYSATRLLVETEIPNFELDLFDSVTFLDPDPVVGTFPSTSGDYLISKVVHSVSAKSYSTIYELNKPAINLPTDAA